MTPTQPRSDIPPRPVPRAPEELVDSHTPKITSPAVTRFGDRVDVRSKDAVRITRFANGRSRLQDAPAVVRIWHNDQCRELTPHEARGFAAQLLAAATLADSQNR